MKQTRIFLCIALMLCLLCGCAGPAPVVELRPSPSCLLYTSDAADD